MYLDPTAGSLVLQVLAAGALSAVALFGRVRESVKTVWHALVRLVVPRRWAPKR